MSTEPGSLDCEGMYSKLVDSSGIQDDDTYDGNIPHTQGDQASAYSGINFSKENRDQCMTVFDIFVTSLKAGQRLTHQGPYRLATACLGAFCLILLLVLVTISVYQKNGSSTGDQNAATQNHSITSLMQTNCINVTAMAAEKKTQEKENSDLLKEIDQLKARIKVLEATPTPEPVRCSKSWLYFNGSCYYISTFTRTWRDSQVYCKNKGGHLAIIHTAEEQTFLWDLLPRGHWNSYWFGISDEKLEGDWYWVDGTKLVGGFWEEGEPNNHINEDCGYIVKTEVLSRIATKSWYDAPCSMSLPWICEKKAEQISN